MSEQTASSGFPASARTLDLSLDVAPARRTTPDGAFALARLTFDAASFACAAVILRTSTDHALSAVTLVAMGLAIVMSFTAAGLYLPQQRTKPLAELRQILMIPAAITMLAAAGELALNHPGAGDSAVRLWLLSSTLTATARVSLVGVEQVVRRNLMQAHGATLIVGAGRVGHLAAQRLIDEPGLGLRPVGFLDKEPLATEERQHTAPPVALPVLGASWDLEEVVADHHIEHVLIAFSTAPHNVVLDLVRRCWKLGVSVMVIPRLYEVEGVRAHTEHLGALPLITLDPSDPLSWKMQVKYAFDRVVAAMSLLLLSPIFALISLAILITAGRPLFFRQRRVGRDGHVFEMLKFRTMSGSPQNAGEFDAEWAMASMGVTGTGEAPATAADRRTPLGQLLRRTSLDELPQLWNVVRGDMSLVGPRPERLHYVELFEQSIYRYPDRHRVKAGLTGWAQVNGLRGDTSLADRIEWDNFYIENWSPWLDAKILLRTIPALFTGRGAR
jgi:exopolysaccharide biosynthesis polyprenyl glycosylphosphotransferase